MFSNEIIREGYRLTNRRGSKLFLISMDYSISQSEVLDRRLFQCLSLRLIIDPNSKVSTRKSLASRLFISVNYVP